MADVGCTFTKIGDTGNENCDMPPPCLPSVPVEITKLMSEGSEEKYLLKEKKETMAEVDMDNVGAESCDMPPPCLPSKPSEKTEIANEGSKEKASSKEKKETVPELPYKEPSWSGIPEELYSLEVLKNGCIVSTIDLTSKPFHVFGRLPNCDVSLEHPSVSRYHAVIQHKTSDTSNSEKGFYIYDLGSTHGTIVNKSPLEPRRYYRLRVGYVFKFGGSSRLFILQVSRFNNFYQGFKKRKLTEVHNICSSVDVATQTADKGILNPCSWIHRSCIHVALAADLLAVTVQR